MAVESPPFATQAGSFGAEQTRRAIFAAFARTAANSPGIIAGGLLSPTDCQISAPASGMSVNVSTGEMIIGGTEGGSQGAYGPCRVTSTTNLAIATANATNPRIDTIVGTVNDAAYTAPAGTITSGNWGPQVITGTATAGANLTNLTGAGAVPLSSLLLGYCLVPAAAANIVTADILNVAGPATISPAVAGFGGPTVRAAVNIATAQSAASTTYTTLSTPDQVTGIVMPTNGLIAVWYQATWQESVAGAARAALFLGSNQVKAAFGNAGNGTQAAATTGGIAGTNAPLVSTPVGLVGTNDSAAYGGDVTTGQVVGYGISSAGSIGVEYGGASVVGGAGETTYGGPCYIFAAAGTYTISVQFKASSGTVTASNRKLWVQALPFN